MSWVEYEMFRGTAKWVLRHVIFAKGLVKKISDVDKSYREGGLDKRLYGRCRCRTVIFCGL